MCGGGGGGGGQDPSYQANIDRQNKIDAAQNAQNQIDAAQRATDAATATNAAALTTAKGNAPGLVSQYFADRGINADPGTVQRIVDSITATIPANDPNPAQYYGNDAIAGQVAAIENTNRQGYNAQLNKYFAPGFENTLLPTSSIDPVVNSILSDQQKTAQQSLDFNKARGLLNDTGYNAAEGVLGQQSSAGRATLQNIANSVLGTERQGLTDIRGEAGTAASNYSFGQPAPDFGTYQTQAQQLAATDLSNIEGSVRGAVGSTNFFDVPTALQKGGVMQGPINLTTAASAGGGGGGPPVTNKTLAGRGIGSTGVF